MEIFAGSSQDAPLLVNVNRTIGRTEFVRLSRFDFNEYQGRAIPPDEINFGRTRSRAEITGNDGESSALQIPVREILAAAAEGQIGIPPPPACAITPPVEGAV
jgi:hypothetical protein